MKYIKLIALAVLALALLLAACAEEDDTPENPDVLTVISGDSEHTFTQQDLQELPQTTATFNEIDYVGVTIPVLLEAAEIEVDGLVAVKAVATDGFTANYEPDMFSREDVILAYAQADGPLSDDDGKFRMVLPGEEGRLNVRMVVKIEAID